MAWILGHDDLADDDVLHFRWSMATIAASFHCIVEPFSVQLGVLTENLAVLQKARFIHDAEHVATRVLRDLYACLLLQSQWRMCHGSPCLPHALTLIRLISCLHMVVIN